DFYCSSTDSSGNHVF
nr:immunoglobulin light chain junction region [Macaca mulatta]MOV73663.1 immunoglobulin light chain junction region [Macaca mulatta]MOV73711.1 immunoglobulin light chain junction region [Macaca mulatta]